MPIFFFYQTKQNSPAIRQFPSFSIFGRVTVIKRLRHKKTSRFTFGEKIHFVLGLLARDIANHSYAPNTP